MLKEILFGGSGATTKLGDIGLLILRLFAGIAFTVAHGLVKVQNPGIAINSARSLNFPVHELFGWAAILSEFLGGILLALGLLTRPAALFIAGTMCVAAFMVHGNDGFKTQELALVYLSVMILFLCTGGGRFSVDSLIRK